MIEEIYEMYSRKVFLFLLSKTNNEDIAEELTQETFYKAIQKINTFKNDCRISVWLCQIAKNLWYDELKKSKRIKDIREEEYLSIQTKIDMEENIIFQEDKKKLYQRINNLNEQMKSVIYLRIIGDLSLSLIHI